MFRQRRGCRQSSPKNRHITATLHISRSTAQSATKGQGPRRSGAEGAESRSTTGAALADDQVAVADELVLDILDDGCGIEASTRGGAG